MDRVGIGVQLVRDYYRREFGTEPDVGDPSWILLAEGPSDVTVWVDVVEPGVYTDAGKIGVRDVIFPSHAALWEFLRGLEYADLVNGGYLET